MPEIETIIQTLGIIGAVLTFIEWRFRSIHKCTERIEQNLNKHLDETKLIIERFFKLEQKVNDM